MNSFIKKYLIQPTNDKYKEIYTTKSINVTELSQKAVEETVNDISKEVNK